MPRIHGQLHGHISRGEIDDAVKLIGEATGTKTPEEAPKADRPKADCIAHAHNCVRNDDLTGARSFLIMSKTAKDEKPAAKPAGKGRGRGRKPVAAAEE